MIWLAVVEGIDDKHIKLIPSASSLKTGGSTSSSCQTIEPTNLHSSSRNDQQNEDSQSAQHPISSWSSKTGQKDEAWRKKWDTMEEDMGDTLQSGDSPKFLSTGSASGVPPLPSSPAIGLTKSASDKEWT